MRWSRTDINLATDSETAPSTSSASIRARGLFRNRAWFCSPQHPGVQPAAASAGRAAVLLSDASASPQAPLLQKGDRSRE